MGYADYLCDLLRPLGVYNLDGGLFSSAELEAQGTALDECGAKLDRAAREMILCTAQAEGLSSIENLLPHRPVSETAEQRRKALAALLRIGGDSFTLNALNSNLAGCGISALVSETGVPEQVKVVFPGVSGVPDGFDDLRKIIEDILPCHLEIEYVFRYASWAEIEEELRVWSDFESKMYLWGELEKLTS